MSFLNLSLGELLGLMGVISAGVVALYLLDRSKRKQLVSTLRFWTNADVRTQLTHRRKIQQPWSLLLELLSLALLLAAIAGPRLGVIDGGGRDHVVILDTSAWMASSTPRARGTLMEEARASARAYVRSLSRRDRVMLVRADALATPATRFESSRASIEDAIRQSLPGASALNLGQAFEYAQRAQRLQAERSGEIVFIGAGRVSETDLAQSAAPPNLRVIPVSGATENIGLRKVGLRRSPSQPDTWDIFVAVRNFGTQPHTVDLGLQFAKSPAGNKRLTLPPGGEQQATFSYRTRVGGFLEARLNVRDAFPQDDRALIELPAQASLRVVVYSADPQSLQALVAANPQVEAVFESPAKYDAMVKADVVVLDRFAPGGHPRAPAIWIQPPAAGSPVPVRGRSGSQRLETWRQETSLSAGLHTKDVQLESPETFSPASGDIVVAETTGGPVIVARESEPRTVVLGFHPGQGQMRYELATPLLMANMLRWMAPGAFRLSEVQAGTVGTVNVPVEKNTDPASVHVLGEHQLALPFTIEGNVLRFFAGAPGNVSVRIGDRETVYSLTLPDVAEAFWKSPANARHGIPRSVAEAGLTTDLWPWLAVLGGLGLLIDWLLFGRSRAFVLRASRKLPMGNWRAGWRKAS